MDLLIIKRKWGDEMNHIYSFYNVLDKLAQGWGCMACLQILDLEHQH